MKISIVTTSFNSIQTLADTLESVKNQTAIENIEHIVVDGNSTDGCVELIKSYPHVAQFISEPDKGIYDAMNKGVALATGEAVGFLNSDDFFFNNTVIEKIRNKFLDTTCDAVYGDLFYVDKNDTDKITRKWFAGNFTKENFLSGWMPPHPTFYVKRRVFDSYGHFNLSLKSSADYELMLRFIYKHGIKTEYIAETLIKMREGGMSNKSILNRLKANKEDARAWKINDLKPRFYTFYLKPIKKIKQFIAH